MPMNRALFQFESLSTQVNILDSHFGVHRAPRNTPSFNCFADGKYKSGVTPVSRAVAIKQAEQEINRILKHGLPFVCANRLLSPEPARQRNNFMSEIGIPPQDLVFQTPILEGPGWRGTGRIPWGATDISLGSRR
jgi:hypothetical protein